MVFTGEFADRGVQTWCLDGETCVFVVNCVVGGGGRVDAKKYAKLF